MGGISGTRSPVVVACDEFVDRNRGTSAGRDVDREKQRIAYAMSTDVYDDSSAVERHPLSLDGREKLAIARDSLIGLALLFVAAAIANFMIDSPESRGYVLGNIVMAVVLSLLSCVPGSVRLYIHVVLFFVMGLEQIATDPVNEVQGHLLYVVSILLFNAYGFSKKRSVFWFVLFFGLWLAALFLSGLEYIYQPLARAHGDTAVRAYRMIGYFGLYLCTAWQFYVIWIRPRRRLQSRYERVTRKSFVSAVVSDQGARHPIDAALDVFVDLKGSRSVSREMIASATDELREYRDRLAAENRSIRRTLVGGHAIPEVRRKRSRGV